jgi:pimeloyl-ACP methyl ester carboxylesterase
LILNGRYDTNVPFFEAEKVYENIGTPIVNKSLIILEKSGHLPFFTEPELLAESIIAFIEKH